MPAACSPAGARGPIVAVCVLAAPEGVERMESSGLGVQS